MATRKNPQAQQEPDTTAANAAVYPDAPAQEGQGTPLPELTVRIFPIKNSRSKLRATANVNIAGAFAVQGFRIFDSKKGLFVKEPEQSYIKEGTELNRSVFFAITAEARKALHGQILHSYEITMEKELGQRDDLDDLLNDEYAPPERQYESLVEAPPPPVPEVVSPDDDLPFDMGMSM